MNNSELIKELRTLTGAGMKDCKDAIDASGGDLEKAIDLIKVKGLNIADARAGKVAAEGRVEILNFDTDKTSTTVMVEVNCQTDFTANSAEFKHFAKQVVCDLGSDHVEGNTFDSKRQELEDARKDLISKTKENIVIRRWWIEETFTDNCKTFSYIHSNNKIGVVISMKAQSKDMANSKEFAELAIDLAMQVAAMNPLGVSVDRLEPTEVERQRAIFEAQLTELNKPKQAWEKIITGKFNKWHSEVCLLEQESIVLPKTLIKQVIKNMSTKLGGDIEIINFTRCQVGEGIETIKEDFASEVTKARVC